MWMAVYLQVRTCGFEPGCARRVGPHAPNQSTLFLSAEVRSGYRIQASQQDDSMRVLYYMEKELANFDPARPGPPNGRVERGKLQI